MIEDYIDALVKIANSVGVIKELESHIAFPMKVETWQVRRILRAQELLQNEWEIYQTARGTLSQTSISN